MKARKFFFVAVLMAICAFVDTAAYAGQGEAGDRTLSPYFFVKSGDAALDQMPLKSTGADVIISGVIADVKVTQVYRNAGKEPLEAVYVFPASSRAAVYGMKMTIGRRTIEAKIKKREDARQEYEQAKNQGKSASLLEQQRPNVFQMNVANIMPGDEIRVELKYTELIIPEDKVYEFVYPTVVGPRYSSHLENGASERDKWSQNPYLKQGKEPAYTFGIRVRLSSGVPISSISCSTHKVKTVFSGKTEAKVDLERSEAHGGNRDYILRYRLDGEGIQSGLLVSKGKDENFFLLMMQPPKRVVKADIPGREYIFIIDVSGSMYGFPLDTSKELMRNLIGNLRPSDRFNVMLFSGGSTVMSEESMPATKDNIAGAINMIDNQHGGGGTELVPALNRALALKRAKGFSRTVVIATDGYVTVEADAFDLIRRNLGDANMFAFGIGSSVNRFLIEGIAHAGMGEPFIVEKPEDAPAKAEALRKMIASPVLTRIKVSYEGFDAYDVEPLGIPDVLSERPVLVFGKFRGRPGGKIAVSGVSGDGRYSKTIDVSDAAADGSEALKYLWARQRIMLLSDYNKLSADDGRVREVTGLGLKYNLLTQYTSFVAVDTEIRNVNGKMTTVKQPLPLPQGVSDYAVGGNPAGRCLAASTEMMKQQTAPSVYYGPGGIRAKDSNLKEELKAGASPALRVRELKVSGGISQREAYGAVSAGLKSLESCMTGKKADGSISVKLRIDIDGSVKDVDLKHSMTLSRTVRDCLTTAMKKWTFKKSPKGATVTFVVYTAK